MLVRIIAVLEKLFGCFGIATGALSLSFLAKQGLKISLYPPLETFLGSYNDTLVYLLGPAQPLLTAAIRYFYTMTGWEIALAPRWKHTVVLCLAFGLSSLLLPSFEAHMNIRWRRLLVVLFGLAMAGLFLGAVDSGTATAIGVGLLAGTVAVFTARIILGFIRAGDGTSETSRSVRQAYRSNVAMALVVIAIPSAALLIVLMGVGLRLAGL